MSKVSESISDAHRFRKRSVTSELVVAGRAMVVNEWEFACS